MNNLYVTCLTILSFCLFSACGNHLNTTYTNNQLQPNEVNTKKLSIVEKLKENSHLPVKERIALYHKLKANHFDSYDFGNETELTLYGYSFMPLLFLNSSLLSFQILLTPLTVWVRLIF